MGLIIFFFCGFMSKLWALWVLQITKNLPCFLLDVLSPLLFYLNVSLFELIWCSLWHKSWGSPFLVWIPDGSSKGCWKIGPFPIKLPWQLCKKLTKWRGLFLNSLLCFIIPYVYPYANSTLSWLLYIYSQSLNQIVTFSPICSFSKLFCLFDVICIST